MIAAWMLYASVVGACAAVAALAMEPLMVARGVPRRMPWLAALATALLLPAAVAVRPVATPAIRGAGDTVALAATTSGAVASAERALDWDRGLMLAWAIASALMVATIVISAAALWRARHRARAVVLDGVRVALTHDTGPGALWFGATRIVVPESLASLEPSRRALLVRHEDEHVRAGDPYLLLTSLAALALAPWNPALWFIARRLRTALELDCDARVLAGGADVRAYGELLLTVAAARRPPRLAAYLAFAASPSPLERRIRAMTSTRPAMGPVPQLSLGLVALAALVSACETRRPDPIAPVPSYTVADGRATASRSPTGADADSARARLSAEVRDKVPGPTLDGNAMDPLVMVYDAEGRVVMSGRMGAKDAAGRPLVDSLPIPVEAIATVDVIKNGDVLPPEAKGGLIKVVLKPSAGPMKRSTMATAAGGQVSGGEGARPSAPPTELLVIIRNSEGAELYREVIANAGSPGARGSLDNLPVDRGAIATVDVRKSSADRAEGRAEVHVTLKPGEGLKAKR